MPKRPRDDDSPEEDAFEDELDTPEGGTPPLDAAGEPSAAPPPLESVDAEEDAPPERVAEPTSSPCVIGPANARDACRRGARASFYRKPQSPSGESSVAGALAAADGASEAGTTDGEPAERSPHEILLDACDEGALEVVEECLRRADIDTYLNLSGVAKNIASTGRPELLCCGRGETALRHAAFHGYARIVQMLLDAGAVAGLRNDEAKSAADLAQAGGQLLGRKPGTVPVADLPRGDPTERVAVIQLLLEANAQQWIIVAHHVPDLNGRIAQVSGVRQDGLRRAIVDDSEASSGRPYFQKGAVRSALLRPDQLRRLPPPAAPLKVWPLDARFQCVLAGKERCECEFAPQAASSGRKAAVPSQAGGWQVCGERSSDAPRGGEARSSTQLPSGVGRSSSVGRT
uniref:Uncharacterized protein n=1 Tax=Haptolina brevifila TaxID=156173 RepID=A0A7S2NRA6_9EUKA|mmetsp:Transcript_86760/g.173170  ORF Transcript_86760/g.173170 Transcript_86760/m.173170 type:complete len:402 (+) Transcript_86760:131-1336(+)